jgi:hypothetical protein
MNFDEVAEFTKEFKRLAKKYPTLPNDLEVFKMTLPLLEFEENKNCTVLKIKGSQKVIKVRLKVACLRGVPKLRIVFILRIEKNNVSFLEIYTKSEKDREDEDRINAYL